MLPSKTFKPWAFWKPPNARNALVSSSRVMTSFSHTLESLHTACPVLRSGRWHLAIATDPHPHGCNAYDLHVRPICLGSPLTWAVWLLLQVEMEMHRAQLPFKAPPRKPKRVHPSDSEPLLHAKRTSTFGKACKSDLNQLKMSVPLQQRLYHELTCFISDSCTP